MKTPPAIVRIGLPLSACMLFAMVASCRPVAQPHHNPPPVSQTPVPAPAPAPAPTPQPTPNNQLTGESRLTAMRGPRVDSIQAEPKLRIRLAQALEQATFGGKGSITVGPGSSDLGKARTYTFQTPLRIKHDGQGFVITEPNGSSVRWRLSTLSVTGNNGQVVIDNHPYPGKIELVAIADKAGGLTGRFDTVNHVGMEAYLPGVLSQELYPSWDIKAYRAQAIAARSYAIWEMSLPLRVSSHFDLEAGQASQAYVGAKASDKAIAAVAETTGQVLVYNSRVLPAFYSSCSGGKGQDAVAAWPGKVDDLEPLRGRDHGAWGQQSTKFRWGPVVRDRATLSRQIVAWGVNEKNPVASLGTLKRVDTIATNSVGRPTRVRLTDDKGKVYELGAEELRMAANFRSAALPTLDPRQLIFSSQAEYVIAGNSVTVTGRGFGHGVGMDQWGAQHMAGEGYDHRRILGFYYPGTEIKKAY